MEFFNGVAQALKLEDKIANATAFSKHSKLLLVLIGDNPASEKFVSLKLKLCQKYSVACEVKKFSASNLPKIESFLRSAALDENVGSIIIQLPLPDKTMYSLLDLIPVAKDIDMLSEASKKLFYTGDFSKPSPIIHAVEHFIYSTQLNYDSLANVGIIGNGELVGRPLYYYFSQKVANTTQIVDYKTNERLNSDLLILATDIPNLVLGQNISNNCHVIDFGSTVINGKTVGNLDLSSKLDHLGIVSKSPGGMGPLVVRYLVMNHLKI